MSNYNPALMKEETTAKDIQSLVEDSTPDLRIKSACLLPNPDSRLDTMHKKFHPMNDENIPYRDMTDASTKKESIRQLIDKLDVTKSLRYQRTVEDTYCNVYSYDFCYFSRVYLPTVWWTDESLEKILNGQEVIPVFDETVAPIYSSAIHDWLLKWGASFGWKRMTNLDEIQQKVNEEGGIGMICAKRKIRGLSGHIVPIVPETNLKKAYRENDVVIYPLQSQAGKLNYTYFSKARKDWWNHERYCSHVFYYHD
tara:strand:+ start:2653 stop:3414 length:762 start_codon:yes stop_codon:yes gene_type:complete